MHAEESHGTTPLRCAGVGSELRVCSPPLHLVLRLRLESAGQLMKGDSGLCQPAEPSRAEPSPAEPSRAEPSRAEPSRAEPGLLSPPTLGADSELLLIRPRRLFSASAPPRSIHVSVERRITLLTHVETAFNTSRHADCRLRLPYHRHSTSCLACVALWHFHDSDALDLCLVFEDVREPVERPRPRPRPPVQVKIPVPTQPRPQFFDSPLSLSLSSSRTPASFPTLIRPTSCSTHRSTMCLAKQWTKWVRRSDHFAWRRVTRSPSESSQLAISVGK
ncbi:MAG: hypothetical protein J07HQW2_00441 [Haloquadratum walsbyi J07HQW2]|uniref:Uncharacterized protein n=1 Tax=Haloquadratum walsbyi J07HQW2 TaxID=1238425 RepID=U1PK12_9EURY|nr:MAG: hypothetical protein J07HQW2_00441 [Haloquadratum walsbyi J07HQW2]